MGNKTGVMAYRGGLALAGWLVCAMPSLAQGTGGLVISSLPSDVVIGSAPTDTAPPVQLLEAALTPMDPTLPVNVAVPRAGLPRPSINVGDMAVLAALGPRGPLGMPFQLREAIRQRDAALFDRLLGRGVFDPDPDRMAEAIQTELQRVECYGGGIDGAWGSGSARAVERWQQAAGSKIAGDPQPQLFRAIARSGDLRCAAVARPDPVAKPRPEPGGSKPEKPRKPTPVVAKPVQPPKPVQPTQPTSTTPQFNPSMIGSGMFR